MINIIWETGKEINKCKVAEWKIFGSKSNRRWKHSGQEMENDARGVILFSQK